MLAEDGIVLFITSSTGIGVRQVGVTAAKTSTQFTTSSLKLGLQVHEAYRPGSALKGVRIKEFRLPSGKRVDFIDFKRGTVTYKMYNVELNRISDALTTTTLKL